MFADYLVEEFMTWSLKTDYKSVVYSLNKEKEQFVCDMYNHFATSFKDMPIFELHMFRVSSSKIVMLESDIISISLPDGNKYHSMHLVYDDKECNYFVLNKSKNGLDLINHNDKKVCGVVNSDLSNLNSLISNYIISK